MTVPIIAARARIRDTGGVLRIAGTGVMLETVLWAFLEGSTPENIVDRFPTLTLADAYEAIGYYLRHREELDRYLDVQEQRYRQATEHLIQQIPRTPIQSRLQTRRR